MSKGDLTILCRWLFFFVIFSIISDRVLHSLLVHLGDQIKSGQAIGKVNHYLEVKEDSDLIVFGSSRANHNLITDKLSINGFNMGVDGRSIAYAVSLIELLDDKKQVIILHITPGNAFKPSYEAEDLDALLPFSFY